MFQQGPSSSISTLAAAILAIGLVACSDSAQGQSVETSVAASSAPAAMGSPEPAAAMPAQTQGVPDGMPVGGGMMPGMKTPAVMAADMYAYLEFCDVDDERLQKVKQDMRNLAAKSPVGTPDSFDGAFAAALPAAREETQAEAAANPTQMEQNCEKERRGF